jgi:hypothetical protein
VREQRLQLPSGREILARKPEPVLLASWGLSLNILKTMRGEGLRDRLTDAAVADLAWAMGQVVMYCFAKPQISPTPQGLDQVHPREVSLDDALFVIQWALTPEEPEVPLSRKAQPEIEYAKVRVEWRPK